MVMIMDVYDIVIIDSGINTKHPAIERQNIKGFSFEFLSENEYRINNDLSDEIGHGTAVYFLISKYLEHERVLNIKVFSDSFEPSVGQIIAVLRYLRSNISCKILHLSNGIVFCDEQKRLLEICHSLIKAGVIIVCAFENTGIISYPAAFKEVIGVDWSLNCRRINEFEYIENSCINVRGIGTDQRVPWLGNTYNYVSGSSFAAPHITGEIIRQHRNNKLLLTNRHILSYFKSISKRVYYCNSVEQPEKSFAINKAIVFPLNKEIHALVRFDNLLNFEILKYYDLGILGNTGKLLTDVVISDKPFKNHVIENYDQLDWNLEFDTVILGHTNDIASILNKDIIIEILKSCIKYKKNLFCFDSLKSYSVECEQLRKVGCYVYSPYIDKRHIPANRFGKLHSIGKPMLMVMGTSSKQGKFTLQLILREMFIANGYSIGQLGTEPSSLLFGMDEVYPMGFGSTVELQNIDAISVINQLLYNIESKDPDIILLGSQSHTLQLNTGNTAFYPLMNYELLLASDPDAIVLCINHKDSLDYIKRCISFLENFVETKVIALVLFPIQKSYKWSVMGTNKNLIDQNELNICINNLKNIFKIPIFNLADKNHMKLLFNHCVSYFISE
jgi:hypothetical protein